MHRYAIVDTNTKTLLTVVEYDATPANPPPGFEAGVIAIQSDAVGGDWTWDGSALVAPPPPPPPPPVIPATISDRQFFQQLAVAGIITESEALAAVQIGTVPAEMAPIVAQMPAEQQFAANMILSGATVFERQHPMTTAIGTAYGWTPDQIDAFFIAAARL